MPQPLDYERVVGTPRPPWHRRVPLAVLFALLLVPPALFGQGCRKMEPGEKLRPNEILLPAIGYSVAPALALVSFPASSRRRRIRLTVVILLALIGLAGILEQFIEYS